MPCMFKEKLKDGNCRFTDSKPEQTCSLLVSKTYLKEILNQKKKGRGKTLQDNYCIYMKGLKILNLRVFSK